MRSSTITISFHFPFPCDDPIDSITNLTSAVSTVDEDLTTDSSDTGLVIDSAGGDTDGLVTRFAMNFAADGSGNAAVQVHELDGILCHNGLRIESTSQYSSKKTANSSISFSLVC